MLDWNHCSKNERYKAGSAFCLSVYMYSACLSHSVKWLFVLYFFYQATLENNLPSEIVSKINLVDLAGRWGHFLCTSTAQHVLIHPHSAVSSLSLEHHDRIFKYPQTHKGPDFFVQTNFGIGSLSADCHLVAMYCYGFYFLSLSNWQENNTDWFFWSLVTSLVFNLTSAK